MGCGRAMPKNLPMNDRFSDAKGHSHAILYLHLDEFAKVVYVNKSFASTSV